MAETEATEAAAAPARATVDWRFLLRVAVKALVLFALLNIAFAACRPLDALGRLSLYNAVLPGRDRLPYGEVPPADLNLTLNNLPAMFASQALARPKADDEFRVLVVGDSGTWGWLLEPDETLAAQISALGLTADGRRVVAYNLGYPVMSLTKDLLLIDAAMAYNPDLIVWPVTMQSFAGDRQLDHPLLQTNAARVRDLIARYGLDLDPADPRFEDRSFLEETIVARRRDLADLLRLQTYGLAWAATGRDQDMPDEITLRKSDFEADVSWLDVQEPRPLTGDDLAFDVLAAGIARAGDVPVLLVNEPIFISDGVNSDLRYNSFYPRWAYDQYREQLSAAAAAESWRYLDLWDAIAPEAFTDTPVHLTPEGTAEFARRVAERMLSAGN